MKNIFRVLLLLTIAASLYAGERKMIPRYNTITKTWAAYPLMTIKELQWRPQSDLLQADVLQNSNWVRDTLQYSRHLGDTVVVEAVVVAPHYVITFTARGMTMLIHEAGTDSNDFRGILVREGAGLGGDPDSLQAVADGFFNIEQGDIIRITGFTEEFPTPGTGGSMNSTTQFRPVYGVPIELMNSGQPLPQPTLINASDLYVGAYPGGQVKYSTGEQYESGLVELQRLTVTQIVGGRGTFNLIDSVGNTISDLDISWHFSVGHYDDGSGHYQFPGDTNYIVPQVGAVLDVIRGTITCNSGGENNRGYRLCPLFPGDIQWGISKPTVNTHRRYPVVVTGNDTVAVQVHVARTGGGYGIYKAVLMKSINYDPWVADTMELYSLVDSTYQSILLDPDGNPLPAGTNVRYFIKGIDTTGLVTILANSSVSQGFDTSKGFFFYNVLSGPMKISDIQYTPYENGRSPYVGGIATVSGILTAGAAEMKTTPLSSIGTSAFYIQNGTGPWNGIWVVKKDSLTAALLGALVLGDSVTITGTIQEWSYMGGEVTRILDSLVVFHSHAHKLPSPVTLASGVFGPSVGNGDPGAEPYEGTLIRIVGAHVTNIWPYYSDPTEYDIDDGSGPIRVRRDGMNTYSNIPGEDTVASILHLGDRVDTLIGIAFYSNGNYKIVPRTNADFVVGEPYRYDKGWNMISVARGQDTTFQYQKTVLFPSAISSAFSYDNGYIQEPVLANRIGYWLKFAGDETVRQLGSDRTSDTVFLKSGWNLIGTLSTPVLRTSLGVYPPGNHLGQFFGYKSGYAVKDTLLPTKAYWVKSDSAGYLLLSATAAMLKSSELPLSALNTLTITDKNGMSQVLYFALDAKGTVRLKDYEMPPSSPAGASFDARYASGRVLETYPTVLNEPREYPITVDAKEAPYTIHWNIVNQAGKRFTIADRANGKTLKTRELTGTGSVAVTASGLSKFVLQIEAGSTLPREFSLGQNYPNPFNPTTTFQVGLPVNSHLEITVYDILGQKVTTLVNENRTAGYHMINWNGTAQNGNSVASGVYFIRMMADKFNAVNKIMLLK